MQIDISDHTDKLSTVHEDLLQRVLAFAAEKEKVNATAEVSVTMVTNTTIKSLNEQYRHKNEATDVLSFEMDNPFRSTEITEPMPVMLGDIVISYDKVVEQAERYNHSFERELAFLVLHGFLHLLGYTHDDKEEEIVMFQKQETILEDFKLERS